jgi:hypothetical protein
VAEGVGNIVAIEIDPAPSATGTGWKAGNDPGTLIARPGSTLFHSLYRERLIHTGSMLVFRCSSRTTAATDAPGLPQTTTAVAFELLSRNRATLLQYFANSRGDLPR